MVGQMVLWIGGLMFIGLAGFVFMSIVLVCRAFGACVRAVAPPRPPPVPGRGARGVCRNQGCRHVNRRGARFCANCGQPLDFDGKSHADG